MATQTRVTVIGEILVEIMATTSGFGFLEPQPLIGPFPSGAPAIFIDQVAKLGQPASIISAVGQDDFGTLNLERLRRDGVDVSAVAVLEEAVTGSAFVRYRLDGNRDFVFNLRHSASGRIAETAEALKVIAGTNHLHVMGSTLSSPEVAALTTKAMSEVKRRGGTVSFDPNIRKEIMGDPEARAALKRVLAGCDIFLPSGEEMALFTDRADEGASVDHLLGLGIREIVLKRGVEGASHFSAAGAEHVSAFAVEEIDPTGAGDCFGAAFVVARLRGEPVTAALRLANAAGARAVMVQGPMEGTSTRPELDAFIASTPVRT